jgi:hypothetical protein
VRELKDHVDRRLRGNGLQIRMLSVFAEHLLETEGFDGLSRPIDSESAWKWGACAVLVGERMKLGIGLGDGRAIAELLRLALPGDQARVVLPR